MKQIDTTIDAENVDKEDAAHMIMTKYGLNLFDIEQDESVYKLLVDDMNTTKSAYDSFDVNSAFKPRIKSALEETRLNDSTVVLDETIASKQPVVTPVVNDGFKQPAQRKPPFNATNRDVLDSITSPFPVHEENLRATSNGVVNGDGIIC